MEQVAQIDALDKQAVEQRGDRRAGGTLAAELGP
jgi:hypothetical protein